MSVKEIIKSHKRVKAIVHWMLIPRHQARPRLWVRWMLNPFYHKRGRHSVVRRSVRMDVLPFNKFELGAFSTIEDFCVVNNGVGDVIIGEHCRIGMSNVLIGPIHIGNDVIIAQNVVMSGLNHVYEDVTTPISRQDVNTAVITVEDECWIGANVVITAGISIGKHSVVAAGSVVTKPVPAYSVVVGNPARVIKKYDFERNQWVKITQ